MQRPASRRSASAPAFLRIAPRCLRALLRPRPRHRKLVEWDGGRRHPAQSIGEPGTQLTMRTFHIGGTAAHRSRRRRSRQNNGAVNSPTSKRQNKKGDLRGHEPRRALVIHDQKGRERERPPWSTRHLKVKDGLDVNRASSWWSGTPTLHDPHRGGRQAVFKDVIEGQTVHEQVDENTGMSALVIMESSDEKKQPRIEIKDDKGKMLRKYLLPSGAHVMVDDQAAVSPGDMLAKIPRETAKTKDITGGLPRVVELFEARRPKEPAVQHRDRRRRQVRRHRHAAPQSIVPGRRRA